MVHLVAHLLSNRCGAGSLSESVAHLVFSAHNLTVLGRLTPAIRRRARKRAALANWLYMSNCLFCTIEQRSVRRPGCGFRINSQQAWRAASTYSLNSWFGSRARIWPIACFNGKSSRAAGFLPLVYDICKLRVKTRYWYCAGLEVIDCFLSKATAGLPTRWTIVAKLSSRC